MPVDLRNLLGGGVKSVQRGTAIIASAQLQIDVTVSAVDVSKTLLINDSADLGRGGELVNANTLRFYSASGNTNTYYWQLLEFK